jgi:type I restriction enzyme S subunit
MRYLIRNRPTPEQLNALASATEDTFLPMEAIGDTGELDLTQVRRKEDVENGYTLCFEEDVLVAKITPCFENGKGAIARGLLNEVGFGTTELFVLDPIDNVDAGFLDYVTYSSLFRKQGEAVMTGAAGQKCVTSEFVTDFRVPVPPLDVQRRIVDYLDRETARIDGLIAAKERLLTILAEQRRALITHAITRGLNPAAPLRDYGALWLDKVPSHWETWKLRHFAQIGNGSTPSRENGDYWHEGSIPWLNSSVVNMNEVSVTGQGKTRGQAVVLAFNATINQHLAYITPQPAVAEFWYLRWLFYAAYAFLRYISDDAGGTKGALTCEELGAFKLPIPPLEEQRAIIGFIAQETGKLDAVRVAAQRTIQLLKDRRAALIATAVTGQLNIPGDV